MKFDIHLDGLHKTVYNKTTSNRNTTHKNPNKLYTQIIGSLGAISQDWALVKMQCKRWFYTIKKLVN